MEIKLGLTQADRLDVADRLNKLLATEYMLYTKTYKYHWNVTGPNFGPLHTLFETQYTELFTLVDEIAEKVRAFGVKAYGTFAEFIEHSCIEEKAGHNPAALDMVRDLVNDYETIIQRLRNDISFLQERMQDDATIGFMANIIEVHEKTAWLLRAHLEK